MYQATHPGPVIIPPTPRAVVWDIQDSLRQTSVIFPTISSTDLTSPHLSYGGYSLVSAQPTAEMYLAQSQVSFPAVSDVVVLK